MLEKKKSDRLAEKWLRRAIKDNEFCTLFMINFKSMYIEIIERIGGQ